MTSFNSVFTIGEQSAEVSPVHQVNSRRAAWDQAIEILGAVRLPNAKGRLGDYSFQMSGGQRQRAMIAMALACQLKILIADKQTTVHDVTVQAQNFDLLRDIGHQTRASIILITHDMSAVARTAERMIEVYAGRNAEVGPVDAIIDHPHHPCTKGLIACVPHTISDMTDERHDLVEMPGIVPSLRAFGQDRCLFASRCDRVIDNGLNACPPEQSFPSGRSADCWHAEEVQYMSDSIAVMLYGQGGGTYGADQSIQHDLGS